MMSPFFIHYVTIGVLLTSVLVSGCVHETGYVHSHYNDGLRIQLTAEQQRRQELESQRQRLKEEIKTLEQEINGLNLKIAQYEKESSELQHKAEKTLNVNIQKVREREAEIKKLKLEVKKKKEILMAKKRELDESFKRDV